MGLSGYAGAAAAKNLEELFAAQLAEELDREQQRAVQEEREANRAFRERDFSQRSEQMRQSMAINQSQEARAVAAAEAEAMERNREEKGRLGIAEIAGKVDTDPSLKPVLMEHIAAAGGNVPSYITDKLKKKEPDLVPFETVDERGNPVTRYLERSGPEATKGVPKYRPPVQGPAPQYDAVMRLNPVTGKMEPFERRKGTGYQPGDQLISGGGALRGVQRSDASTIADYDTSLDDVEVLRGAIGDTGILPSVGASLPNWATSITGWGTEAKSQQAVIDRVKQVIGKALEGGVLRKEDESKYEKILPVLGDHPDVARTKLNGLEKAITQRRERTLESLADAGYDVSGYRERDAAKKPGGVQTKDIPGVPGGVAELRNGRWIRVK